MRAGLQLRVTPESWDSQVEKATVSASNSRRKDGGHSRPVTQAAQSNKSVQACGKDQMKAQVAGEGSRWLNESSVSWTRKTVIGTHGKALPILERQALGWVFSLEMMVTFSNMRGGRKGGSHRCLEAKGWLAAVRLSNRSRYPFSRGPWLVCLPRLPRSRCGWVTGGVQQNLAEAACTSFRSRSPFQEAFRVPPSDS